MDRMIKVRKLCNNLMNEAGLSDKDVDLYIKECMNERLFNEFFNDLSSSIINSQEITDMFISYEHFISMNSVEKLIFGYITAGIVSNYVGFVVIDLWMVKVASYSGRGTSI